MIDIADLKALLDLATKGPWVVYPIDVECPGIEANGVSIVIFGTKLNEDEMCGVQGATVAEAKGNAALIAMAPTLAAAVLRLRAIDAQANEIRSAITELHLAYDRREHGGVADGRLASMVQKILDMPWQQGVALAALAEHERTKE